MDFEKQTTSKCARLIIIQIISKIIHHLLKMRVHVGHDSVAFVFLTPIFVKVLLQI